MSRCFPYPPPNYRRTEESLIESIKLQKEREKENKERRKEKRREKKEKRQKSREEHGNLEPSHKKRKHGGRSGLHEKDGTHKKARKEVIEQLEKSDLTHDHELPSIIRMPCGSSDSTQNSSQSRKLVATDPSHKGTGCTIIRIKLPLLKHKDPEPPCFSGRITEAAIEPESAAETAPGQLSSERSSSCNSITQEERQFRDLSVNWKPLPQHMECTDIGDEWLFGTQQQQQGAKRCGVGSICSSEDLGHERSVCSLQPRACYLPEFDMYQLPYVIQF